MRFLSYLPIYPVWPGIRPKHYGEKGDRTFFLIMYSGTTWCVSGLFDFEYLHACSGCVNFFSLFRPCTVSVAHPGFGFGDRSQLRCATSVCVSALTLSASAVAPRWAKIGNITRGSALWHFAPPSSCGHWDISAERPASMLSAITHN